MQLKRTECMALLSLVFIVMQSVAGYDGIQSKLTETSMQEFMNYAKAYNKKYDSFEEFKSRFAIYNFNKLKVAEMNTCSNGSATYGVTQFSDLSQEELNQKFTNFDKTLKNENSVIKNPYERPPISPPNKIKLKSSQRSKEVDWTKKNKVSAVKDQGTCLSCTAFSAIDSIESAWAIKHGKLFDLAVQESLDCGPRHVCEEASSYNYEYALLIHIGNIPLASSYKYTGERGKCKLKGIPQGSKPVKISNYWLVNHPTDEYIMALLDKVGPVGGAINSKAMHFYVSGVSEPGHTLCGDEIDHAVLLVGYGETKERVKFWKIKNTWGKDWGESGYYYLIRGKDACGINRLVAGPYL